ncbi:uncharacterized protein N7482_003622 [Penicillium canariense]|uniref:SprT-like domain-containing protein n=1 Tax=Penicillium canariense TaxID=189055 RepID=A0A9W9I745_9EURO|nr:uncharacterized protein N7482_003622 [Penicillium canariense]KAJ5168028.1 hypothetical protein N7482_003622 [Penicillium canariense]
MARLNTTNPLTSNFQRQQSLKERADRIPTSTLASEKQITNSRTSNGSIGSTSTQSRASSQRQSRGSSAIFDIFSDECSAIESSKAEIGQDTPSCSPNKQKKTRTLKGANVNSLLLPMHQAPRQRSHVKLETDDYEKENDIMENTPEPYTATREAVPPPSPTRRTVPRIPNRSRPENRPLSPVSPESGSDENCGDNSFHSLDDFIVSDNEDLSFHETSGSETEDAEVPRPPPTHKSTRKRLMRGKRPDPNAEEKTLKDTFLKVPFRLEPETADTPKLSSSSQDSPKKVSQDDRHVSTKLNALNLDGDNEPASQVEMVFSRSIIAGDSSSTELRPTNKKMETPLSSPSRARLRSPAKDNSRIPPSPHRESTDAFWSQEVTNNWNDHYSTRWKKTPGRTVIELLQDFDDSEDENSSRESGTSSDLEPIRKMDVEAPKTPKTPSKTALKKAEAEKNRATKARRLSFNNKKADFAKTFFNVLDHAVSGGEVSRLTEATGGVEIVWSKTLQKTAGRAHWKGERLVSREPDGHKKGLGKIQHHAMIELAERIIDDEYRLINTLAHEYCHLANYIVSNVHDNPHGASFKRWGQECAEVLKDHPIYGGQINVTTKHSYEIDYKYVWSCVSCGQDYGRHSKSINTERVRCGACRGVLQQIKPKPRNVSPKKNATPGPRNVLHDVTRNLGAFTL